jgi:hypothetical protein
MEYTGYLDTRGRDAKGIHLNPMVDLTEAGKEKAVLVQKLCNILE